MDSRHEDPQERIAALRGELSRLEREAAAVHPPHWQASNYYAAYHAASGSVLGIIGAAASLLFNIVGSSIVGQHPLRIIQVYLTFPLGERALSDEFDTGMALAIGCCLYLCTGMLIGIPFQMIMARVMPNAALVPRLLFASLLGITLWGVNFYVLLSWLQPLLIGGRWLLDPEVLPWWVGASTHLVFAWTMALVFPWGKYSPYRRQTERVSPTDGTLQNIERSTHGG